MNRDMTQKNEPRQQERRSKFKPDVIKTLSVESPSQLMAFVAENLPEMKRTRLKQMLAHNQIAVNGMPVSRFDHPLAPGDEVKVNFVREFKVFSHRRLRIVYEDSDIIVVEKGYGLLSMGNDKVKEGTAYSILKDYVKWSNPANKIFIVHRLDRDTSGLMMFAKTIEAKEAMQHNWNNMVLERRYVAIVKGRPEQDEGTISSYLAENANHEVYSTDNPAEGKPAVTRYKVLKSRGGYTMLELQLETGRKNQIRVHLKDLGLPIVGDRRYGAKTSPAHRVCLHALTLRFVHPVTRRDMNFTSAIPAAFSRLV